MVIQTGVTQLCRCALWLVSLAVGLILTHWCVQRSRLAGSRDAWQIDSPPVSGACTLSLCLLIHCTSPAMSLFHSPVYPGLPCCFPGCLFREPLSRSVIPISLTLRDRVCRGLSAHPEPLVFPLSMALPPADPWGVLRVD